MGQDSFDEWVSEWVDVRGPDGDAAERVEEALREDETLAALWQARAQADQRQQTLLDRDDEPRAAVRALSSARGECGQALGTLAQQVVRDTVDE